jgi:hypothetical protein
MSSQELFAHAGLEWQSFPSVPGCIFFLFSVLGFELMAYIFSYSTSPFFVMGFFEIGCHKLFAWACSEPQS